MNKLKAGLVAVTGLAVSVVTLRAVRKRRTTPEEEAKSAAEAAVAETEDAVTHAAAAADHARVAGTKAIEYAREELDSPEVRDEETAGSEPSSRLRRVGKGWIRR
jgi:Tfp pilus assembly protein PilX